MEPRCKARDPGPGAGDDCVWGAHEPDGRGTGKRLGVADEGNDADSGTTNDGRGDNWCGDKSLTKSVSRVCGYFSSPSFLSAVRDGWPETATGSSRELD